MMFLSLLTRLQVKVVGDSRLIRLGTHVRKYELNPNLDVA